MAGLQTTVEIVKGIVQPPWRSVTSSGICIPLHNFYRAFKRMETEKKVEYLCKGLQWFSPLNGFRLQQVLHTSDEVVDSIEVCRSAYLHGDLYFYKHQGGSRLPLGSVGVYTSEEVVDIC